MKKIKNLFSRVTLEGIAIMAGIVALGVVMPWDVPSGATPVEINYKESIPISHALDGAEARSTFPVAPPYSKEVDFERAITEEVVIEEVIAEEVPEEVYEEPYEEYYEEVYEEPYEEYYEEPYEVYEETDPEDYSGSMTYLGAFEATAYEWTGNPCANGNYPTEGYTIACNSLPLGTQVYIEGIGYRVVEDRGASWHSSNWLDLYLGDVASCDEWGIRTVYVYIVN